MNRNIRIYLCFLIVLVLGWLMLRGPSIEILTHTVNIVILIEICMLYIASHIFRMMRLTLLTLDERDKAFPLITAHALTAFPSSFLPFKIGEILRLIAFFHVYNYRRKALVIWLAERLGDVLVITAFILGLYLFQIHVPNTMRTVFILFVAISALGLLSLFSVTKVFVYLNRHLVLSSHSKRGLKLLKISHALRVLEVDIYKSIEGRISGLLLLSILVWAMEILALSLFINLFSIGEPDFMSMFVSGLLASLPGGVIGEANAFGLYQSFALIVLTIVFLVAVYLMNRLKNLRF